MTSNHHTPNATGYALTAANDNAPLSSLDTAITNIVGADATNPLYRIGASSELTIDTDGEITVTKSFHTVDTFSDAASDDLDTINIATANVFGILQAAHTDRTVVLKHGTGNILTPDGNDISLDDTNKSVMYVYDGTSIRIISVSGGSSGGSGLVEIVPETALGAPAANITLSSIPATYADLILIVKARRSVNSVGNLITRFNGDSGLTYSENYATQSTTAVEARSSNENQSAIAIPNAVVGNDGDSGFFGDVEIHINGYANSAITRGGWFIASAFQTASNFVRGEGSFAWENIADPISSIVFTNNSGNFSTGTTYALYGRGTAS